MKVRILIVDDHEILRMGLRIALTRVEDFEVVAEAGSKSEALAQTKAFHPEVIVMDVRLPDGTGIEACREILADYPTSKVIMLTSYADEEAVIASLLAGAKGFIMKEMGSTALCQAIKTVVAGGEIIDAKLTNRIAEKMKYLTAKTPGEPLTERETEILGLIALGKSNKEIAETLYLGYSTVRNYVSSILHKLGYGNRSQLTAYALERKYHEHWTNFQ